MMNYYLDTEFNGFGGELLSLALVGDDRSSIYLVNADPPPLVDWVAENVWPIIDSCPQPALRVPLAEFGRHIAEFIDGRTASIVADWPDDIKYFCQSLITGPGTMVNIPGLFFSMRRIDAYPTNNLSGVVQHNAWWDAVALRKAILEGAR